MANFNIILYILSRAFMDWLVDGLIYNKMMWKPADFVRN